MGWQELADAVINRRVELGMKTRKQLAEATGMTVKTLGEIERAERTSYDPATLARVEQVLKWEPGAINALVSPNHEQARPRIDPAAAVPADADPRVVELAQLLNSPLPAAVRAALLADIDRAMATARREARGLPAHDHGADTIAYSTGGKMYIEAKSYASPATDIPEYLKNLAAADSPLDPSDRDAIRDGMTSLARLGYSLLIVARAADGTTDPRRADLAHPTGVSRIDR